MRLLVFSPYYPPHTGGLESHADEFNKYLSQRGADIVVFTPRLPQDAPEFESRHNNVKVIRFPAFEIIPNYPLPKFWRSKFWRLFFGLFRKKFDIVISRTRFFSTSLLALIYAKIKGVKWIHIEHGSDFVKLNNRLFSFLAKVYDHTFGKMILFFSNANIANSEASAHFCQKLHKGKKCAVIYRGVEIEKIENAPENVALKKDNPDQIIIAFVGRLIDGKGVYDLLEALKDISEDYKLFIVGDGPQRKILEDFSKKLGLAEKIIFFGHKKFEEAIGILKASDVFVNPSYTEGLPTSVIEAALCQKAIIATNVGGTPEIISGNGDGFLIEPKNINLLKEKLELLITDAKLREEFGRNAYQKVKEKFSWPKSIEKYIEIFKKVIS